MFKKHIDTGVKDGPILNYTLKIYFTADYIHHKIFQIMKNL